MGLAAVFTGFSWNIPGDSSDDAWSNCCLYVGPGYGEELLPMQPFPSHHSTVEKDFLGVTIPASGSADPNGDLNIALDTLFNHPNLPAFFSKQMIQHLVTSNPSPAYINRVAQVFKNDGAGVRGNLQAVITAILMDPEARDDATSIGNPQYGKVREALLRYTEWARAFTAQSRTGSFDIGTTEDPIYGLGEMWLRSPTVFNWFSPGYTPPGSTIASDGLLAPEMQMTNVSTVVGYINYLQSAIGANATRRSRSLLLLCHRNDVSPPRPISSSTASISCSCPARCALDSLEPDSRRHLRHPHPHRRSERHQRRASRPRANCNLSHRGVARLRRAAIGAKPWLHLPPNPPPVSPHRLHGFHGRPLRQPVSSRAQLARRHGPGEHGGTDYRALVCIYLQGGNDGHGTVIATDADSYAAFTTARSGAPGLAYPMGELLPITLKTPQSGRTFALNPSLTGVQNLFNAGRAAIVANTGTLVTPATKTQINANSVPLPDSLFSHFDQTAAWQAIASNLGSGEHVGWGGAVADAIEAMNINSNSMFTCISTAGNALFLAGQTVVSAQRHPRRPHSHLRTRPTALRPVLGHAIRSTPSSPPTKPISLLRSIKSSSTAPCRRSPCWPRPWLPRARQASPIPPQYLDPVSRS